MDPLRRLDFRLRSGVGLALLVVWTAAAQAASVVDVHGSDANAITSVQQINDPANGIAGVRTGVSIVESYGEQTAVPYESQGGFALVNPSEQTFDKVIAIEAADQHTDWDSMYIQLVVTNDTSVTWSDYHLEFYTADFSQPLGLTLLSIGAPGVPPGYFGNEVFSQSSSYGDFGGAEIHFWSTSGGQAPDQTNTIWLRWDWGNPLDRYEVGDSIGIRQIATTAVPEPASGSLLALALGVLAWRRRQHRRA